MSLRTLLAAGALIAGSTVAASALPLDQFTLPNANQPKDSSDGLFNHSVPDRWDNNSSAQQNSSGLGSVHFSMRSYSDVVPAGSDYGDANKPMSEFYGPTPNQNNNSDLDPLSDH